MSPPIGSVVAFLKNLPSTPALPAEWVECNGQILTNVSSPFDGTQIPDLNGAAGAQRFLRGATASGVVGGSDGHNHGGITDVTDSYEVVSQNPQDRSVAADGHRHVIETDSSLPSYYEVVWVMRIK